MRITAITSFNQTYYDQIGKKSVESFLNFWPDDIEIVCYVEEMSLSTSERLKTVDFSELSKEYKNFQSSNEGKRVKIFAKKAYSIIHAMENLDTDFLIWLDADTITTQTVDREFLINLCKEDMLATFMGVTHYKNNKEYFSAETGFFILNKKHAGFKEFSKRYRDYYDKKITKNLRRFYDGEVFGAVVSDLKLTYKFNDLCEKFTKKYKTPLKRTPIGTFLVHYKAKSTKDRFIANNSLDD